MKWWQTEIATSQEAADSVIESLLEMGAVGVASEDPFDLKLAYENSNETIFFDPSYLEGLPDHVLVRAFFPGQGGSVRFGFRLPDDEKLSTQDVIKLYDARDYQVLATEDFTSMVHEELMRIGQFLDIAPATVDGRFIDEEDWANQWRKHYRTMKVSDRLVIKPSWEDYKPLQGEKVITLDPGSAFGTGSHESTQLSLEALDEFMNPGSLVLDLGTGSGILAIGAALLGARHVDACDIDPHSVEVARENIARNGLSDKINCFTGELEDCEKRYDVIAANLLADLHIDLADQIANRLSDLGLYLAGGIILDRKEDVIKRFRRAGLGLHLAVERNDWQMLVFHKVYEEAIDLD